MKIKFDNRSINGTEIKSLLKKGIKKLIDNDLFLLKNDVNERSVAHKLAVYLQEELDEFSKPGIWNVDCEYNRVGEHSFEGHDYSKKLQLDPLDSDQEANVFPDIVVHKRGKDSLLVIEMKKKGGNIKGDIKKLGAFIKQLEYRFGAQIIIGRRTARITKWISGA